MLLFAVVLILVVFRNLDRPTAKLRAGPIVIGISLFLFATPVYAAVAGTAFRFDSAFRIVAAILLPVGLYLLTPLTRHD